ncbi:METTL23 (predicted) [Pycnogonum litorale]
MYTWPSAVILSQYIWCSSDKVKDKHILELGAGTALCGIVAAMCGAKVTLTDSAHLPSCLDNSRKSCEANGLSTGSDSDVTIRPLTWGQVTPEVSHLRGNIDVILGSDCFYEPKDFEDILFTVSFLMDGNVNAEFWCAYQLRSCDWSIEVLLNRWGLEAVCVPLSSFEADSHCVAGSNLPGNHTILMYVITHRKQSFS